MKETATNSERILGNSPPVCSTPRLLFDRACTYAHEAALAPLLPPNALIQRAGLEIARLALALMPHAQRIWVACGPGNNGRDGVEAARHLRSWGKEVFVSHYPAQIFPADYDLCIDALLGTGARPLVTNAIAAAIAHMQSKAAPVLAVDLPSGLQPDTGVAASHQVQAQWTLCLLTLKPGLFTAEGRDAAGEVWWNDLACALPSPPCAALNTPTPTEVRPHNSHKGMFGDVGVVGGACGMTGAALLAARAALRTGAGRTYLSLLDATPMAYDPLAPELMLRSHADWDYASMSVVVGCGAGSEVADELPPILQLAQRVVLDADALNAIANHHTLQALVRQRPPNSTVLTPHPLEAARLLGCSTAAVQSNRLAAAHDLAQRFACTVVLKGSGSIIAAPHTLARINPTGNARLATGGTGDVLAGMIGAHIAHGDVFSATCDAVYQHGLIATQWNKPHAMTAHDLINAL